jgi:hypothetical protein
MKHKGEIEEYVLHWRQEGYTIADINEERDNAITRFKDMNVYHDVDQIYEV